MKRLSIFAFCCIFAAGCGSAYDKHEKAAKDLLAALDDLSAALESVKDEASAKAAAAKIEDSADRLEKVAGEIKDLPKLSKADDEKLQKEYTPKFMSAVTRMQGAAPKLQPYAKDPAVQKAAQKLVAAGSKLQSMGN